MTRKLLTAVAICAFISLARANADALSKTTLEDAARGVMKVSQFQEGIGTPVLLLEENHASRLQQVEQAIFLSRAYVTDKLRLREIGVEGYLMDGPRVPFESLRHTGEFKDRLDVAAKRLEAGDISSAEFMAMVFDVNLVPVEKLAEHEMQRPENASRILNVAATVVTLKGLGNSDRKRAEALMTRIKAESDQEKKKELQSELDKLVEKAPLLQKWRGSSTQPAETSIEAQLSTLGDIQGEGKRLGVNLNNATLRQYEQFLNARASASGTMTSTILTQKDAKCIALIIGAAHTPRIVGLLSAAQRPYAVLTPASYGVEKDPSIDVAGYERKLRDKPPPAGSLTAELEAELTQDKHHPQPETRKPSHRAESEIYQFTTLLARGGGGPPLPPGPPYGPAGGFWDESRWKNEFIRVDVGSIDWLDDKGKLLRGTPGLVWDEKRGQPKDARAVIFDVLVRRPDGKEERWTIKARTGNGEGTTVERRKFKDVLAEQVETERLLKEIHERLEKTEDVLKESRDRIEQENAPKQAPEPAPEVHRLKPTVDVDMVIGRNREKVAASAFEG